MRKLAVFLCLYFAALTILPSVKAIRLHFKTEHCHKACSPETDNRSCHNDNCMLNININGYTFLCEEIISFPEKKGETFHKKASFFYPRKHTSHFHFAIWQPPEICS